MRWNAEELDQQMDAVLAGDTHVRPEDGPLPAIARELRNLPDPEFKAKLKSDLLEEISAHEPAGASFEQVTGATAFAEILPNLSGKDFRLFPPDHRSFAVSFLSHTALIVLIASGILMTRSPLIQQSTSHSEEVYLPTGTGGGGSGDRSPIPVTRGTPPRMSSQQLTPPTIVVRRPEPLLAAAPTVIGPPDLHLPQSAHIGDLISSNVVIPSNGAGVGGGPGNGSGTGLGSGDGLGVGPGLDRGAGGGLYRATERVIAPRAIYDPEPEYSEEARKVKHQGIVVLSLVVDQQGRTRDIRVARSLGMGLDEKAIEAVKKWRFSPGTKDGIAVPVQVNVEVNFRLY
jgi:TonB family protein